ncbi:MAG: Uma2 family endonuclease [Cyanobacteriota bacterium]|nr:Uma2 family endonuclease [Cyanobacteriota bacterium]
MKVKIASRSIYYYPDLFVTSDERDRQNRDFKQYPKVMIEVLSPNEFTGVSSNDIFKFPLLVLYFCTKNNYLLYSDISI